MAALRRERNTWPISQKAPPPCCGGRRCWPGLDQARQQLGAQDGLLGRGGIGGESRCRRRRPLRSRSRRQERQRHRLGQAAAHQRHAAAALGLPLGGRTVEATRSAGCRGWCSRRAGRRSAHRSRSTSRSATTGSSTRTSSPTGSAASRSVGISPIFEASSSVPSSGWPPGADDHRAAVQAARPAVHDPGLVRRPLGHQLGEARVGQLGHLGVGPSRSRPRPRTAAQPP